MKKDIAELWCKALRSGEFKQGGYALYYEDTYCVMAVLCTLAMLEGICDYDERNGFGYFDGDGGFAPVSVVKWAGLNSGCGKIDGEFLTLQGLNDFKQWDFSELADLIEEKYEQI